MIRKFVVLATGYTLAAAMTPNVSLRLDETAWLDLGTYVLIACGCLIVVGIENVAIAIWIRVLLWHAERMVERHPKDPKWLARRASLNLIRKL